MLFLAIASAVVSLESPVMLHSRVVSAAIFKPGLAMIVRDVEVPAGSGNYAIDELPAALDGTFWYGSPDGVEVTDVDTAIRLDEASKTYDAKTIPEMIFGNVGKPIRFAILKAPNSEEVWLEGVLTDFNPQTGSMTVRGATNEMRTFTVGQIIALDPKGLATTYTRTGQAPTLTLRFRTSAPKAGHVQFTSLETGAAWTASYRVDLMNDNMSRIEGKAQVALGGLRFDQTDTKLMAGYPNLTSTGRHDLAAGYGTLSEYLSGHDGNFAGVRPGPKDPYELFAQWLQDMRNALARYALGQGPYYGYSYGMGGGGFGGAGGPYSGGYQSAQSGQLLPNETAMFRAESLYAYPIGPTTLEPGDRLTKLLFAQRSPYRTLFHWDAADANTPVVQIVRIHNEGKNPWTGGALTVTKGGVPLAQTSMPFTPAGKDGSIELGIAPDILVDKTVTEIKSDAVADPVGGMRRRRVTEDTKISAENTRDEAITLEVVLTLPGDVKTDGAKLEKLPRRFRDLNPQTRITWQLVLQPGEVKHVTVTNTYLQ